MYHFNPLKLHSSVVLSTFTLLCSQPNFQFLMQLVTNLTSKSRNDCALQFEKDCLLRGRETLLYLLCPRSRG